MSDSELSDGEFDGFDDLDVAAAEQRLIRLNQRLIEVGIGNDDSGDDSDEIVSSDEELAPPNVDAAGDRLNDGWHDFDRREMGLPHIFNPDRQSDRPTHVLGPEKEPVDFFALMFTPDILTYIITETDRYAQKQIADHPNENKSPWSTPTLQEMKAFFGLCFLMGINVKPDIKSYWTTDIAMATPFFNKTMTRDRFLTILRYLHFSNVEEEPQPGEPSYSALYKVQELMNMFRNSMLREYTPKRQVSVDEVMIPFKGRLAFKQYMPAKPTKWGIKMWALAEADSGYMSFCEIYSGKSDRPENNLATHVVKQCIEKSNLTGKGYHVYMDNFFTSVTLLIDLYENYGTSACGTVRINRKGLPKNIMTKKPVGITARGDSKFQQKGVVNAVVWKDKKNVSVISTIHDDTVDEVQRTVKQENGQFVQQNIPCPKMILDYTKYMGGVDRADQYIQYYVFQHKTLKWPKRVFFTMLEILKFNAFILFTKSPNHQPQPGKPQLTFLKFSKSVASGLIGDFANAQNRRGRPALAPVEIRLTERHMPDTFPNRSWCHVCWARVRSGVQDSRKQTKYGCLSCQKHLCLPDCFRLYHTSRVYC